MEKQITDLSVLAAYRKRQVVLNYYKDEDFLWNREGFFFESIQIENQSLSFIKKNGDRWTISLEDFPALFTNNEFPNYYIFRNKTGRLEIYFP